MSKDCPRLSRLGVLAPAALSACMDASVLAVPAAGAIVSTVLKELSKSFMLKKWFHGIMSAKEAEHLMMEKGKNGSFLVRESLTHPGEYVLSVRVRGRVSHVMIRRQQNKYDVGSGEQFDDLVGLIEHFRAYPMTENSGDVLRLLQPVSGTCLRAHTIDQKVQEMDNLQLSKKKSGFDSEFQAMKLSDDTVSFTTNDGSKSDNIVKNRYKNILPYDHSRVVLRRRLDRVEGDYINANYIRSSNFSDSSSSIQSSNESLNSVNSLILQRDIKNPTPLVSKSLSEDALMEIKNNMRLDKINANHKNNVVKDKIYIATQGCMWNTTDDFWRMVWQEDVRVIAMVTNEVENGKKKCERYWPSLGLKENHDEINVKSISETCYEDYVFREFVVSDKTTCRTIFQYQYTAWPDHETPAEPDGIISFIDNVNRRMYRITREGDAPEQNVLCVHCSAGVGRTGTFIVINMLMDKINMSESAPIPEHRIRGLHLGFNCEIDVVDTVKLVREQRNGMVQTNAQYRFIYLALQRYIISNNIRLKKKIYIAEA